MFTDNNYKQLIIARKDLGMSPGKLAVQVSHASMAFLTAQIRANSFLESLSTGYGFINTERPFLCKRDDLMELYKRAREEGKRIIYYRVYGNYFEKLEEVTEEEYERGKLYKAILTFDRETVENWINGSFTKVLCEAKTRGQLEKAIGYAEKLGLVEGEDFFLIKDNCLTELEPEEPDESSPSGGRTLTCIGFRPLPAQIQREISRHYQLWRNPGKQEKEVAYLEWKIDPYGVARRFCSKCKEPIPTLDKTPNYCPFCGREIRGEEYYEES